MTTTHVATDARQWQMMQVPEQQPQASDFWRAYVNRAKDIGVIPTWGSVPADDSSLSQPDDSRTVELSRRMFTQTPPDFTLKRWRENFIPLAQWEGRILEVTECGFTAAVMDQLDGSTPQEEAEIPIDEVSDVDRDLVRPGALFYWTIGYRVQASGQRSRESIIRFRRLPRWSIEEVEHARQRVASSRLKVESAESLPEAGPA